MNPYRRLMGLLPRRPLLVGTVVAYENGVATVEELAGGLSNVRGEAIVGTSVYFRDGVIEGPAESMTEENIEL